MITSDIWNRVLCDMEQIGCRKDGHEILHLYLYQERHRTFSLYELRFNCLRQVATELQTAEEARAMCTVFGYEKK